jgi:hypothetical protein
MDEGAVLVVEEKDKRARFEQTILPHLDAAYNLARWLTRNEHDARCLLQDSGLLANVSGMVAKLNLSERYRWYGGRGTCLLFALNLSRIVRRQTLWPLETQSIARSSSA